MVWVYVDSGEKRTYAATKNYMDKIQILFHIAASQRCVLTVQLLRLLLNFMDHKPHGNKESEQLCYYNSVKTGDIFHSFKTSKPAYMQHFSSQGLPQTTVFI